MPARTGCCVTDYTTRSYDLNGLTRWSANYFQRVPYTQMGGDVAPCDGYTFTALPANTYANGSGGVGATLTGNANGVLASGIVGTIAVGNSFLVKDEANKSHNGIYVITSVGSVSTPYVLTRRSDFDQSSEIFMGVTVPFVSGSPAYTVGTIGTVTVGTTPIIFGRTGSADKVVVCQTVDSNLVIVGGQRVFAQGRSCWSVVCFDIVTGQLRWDYDLGGDCIKVMFDQNGNIVCMVDTGLTGLPAVYGVAVQHFIRLDTSGNFIDDLSFTQPTSTAAPGTQYHRTFDFVINEVGDYHILSRIPNYYCNGIIEWIYPFSSAPSIASEYYGTRLLEAIGIQRAGGRNYICCSTVSPFYYNIVSVAVGKAVQAAPTGISDFDLLIPGHFYTDSMTSSAITPTGTTQATAAPLTVGNDYTPSFPGGSTPVSVILPTGSVGDPISFERSYPTYATYRQCTIFPPVGGSIDYQPTNTGITLVKGMIYVCQGGNNWVSMTASVSQGASCVAVGSSGDLFLSAGKLKRWSAGGAEKWSRGYNPFVHVLDSSDNSYSLSDRFYADSSVQKRDANGDWVWGHRHTGSMSFGYGQKKTIDMDPDGLHVVVSGCDALGGSPHNGPNKKTDDLSFRPNPDPFISRGRTATATFSGTGSSYSVGFSGGVPIAGTILLAVIADDSGAGSGLTITGGSTWTPLVGGYSTLPSVKAFIKVCGSSEPATYTVSYSGTSLSDVSCVAIEEFVHANSTNPVDVQVLANSSTPNSATASSPSDACILLMADFATGTPWFDSAPPGYVLDCWQENYAPLAHWTPTVAIASQLNCGYGTISPGAWGNPDTGQSYHWTVIIKKV